MQHLEFFHIQRVRFDIHERIRVTMFWRITINFLTGEY